MKIRSSVSPFGLVGGIFTFIGTVFLAVGLIWLGSFLSFKKTAVKAEAVIYDIKVYNLNDTGGGSTSRVPWVTYTVDGEEYIGTLDYYSSGMRRGDIVTIYYDPSNPGTMKSAAPVGEIIFIGLGALFAIIGGCFLAYAIKKSLDKKRLIASGERMTGTITNVYEQMNVRVNGRHPLKAEVEVIDPYSGEKYLYSSDGVLNDIFGLIGLTVTVYADPNDRSKYYVDINELAGNYTETGGVHDYR